MWDISPSSLGDGSGRYGFATFNSIRIVGPWFGLVGDLGCIRDGEGHDADRGRVGFSFHDRLVVGGRGKERRQRQR